jgi:hypothetical protein
MTYWASKPIIRRNAPASVAVAIEKLLIVVGGLFAAMRICELVGNRELTEQET